MSKKQVNKKFHGIMLYTWLIISVISMFAWLHSMLKGRSENMLLIMSGVSFLMYLLRYRLMKKERIGKT